ncbi:MAG: putative membrane protein YfcA [Psychromonas sp.]|jgi:uncharacterized membrane protein YfcA|uniref:TSUP family transporter n=1 Tax=Psychromonas sp. TaxID=1884585 RepID=UPI0039E668F6
MDFEVLLGVPPATAAILFLVAILAGFINAVAGGGGLLSIPALMCVGLPPAVVLATNKLQACGGSFFASYYYIRTGMVKIKDMKLPIMCAFIGGALGSLSVQHINADQLQSILPFLVLGIGAYFLFAKKTTDEDKNQLISSTVFAFTAALCLGFYDGFFGPGIGSFYTMAFVSLSGLGLLKATAHARVLTFSSNIAALIFFIIGGHVLWLLGGIMLIGQAVGGTLGSKFVVAKGSKIIRPLIVTTSAIMGFKLLFY